MTTKREVLKALLEDLFEDQQANNGEEPEGEPKENPATSDPVKTENDDDPKESDEAKQLREALAKERIENVQTSIKNGLSTARIDTEVIDQVSEFIAYDKLMNEDGSADKEKIESLIESLSSIALREPPAGGGKKTYDPTNQGLKKYLDSPIG